MKLTLALSKGRIFEETAEILSKIGIVPKEDPEKSRKLIIETSNPEVRLIIVRASDVPTYVQFRCAHGKRDRWSLCSQ
jgi:ATP phosphoribosyltransferase